MENYAYLEIDQLKAKVKELENEVIRLKDVRESYIQLWQPIDDLVRPYTALGLSVSAQACAIIKQSIETHVKQPIDKEAEFKKAHNDALLYGRGFMFEGKHVDFKKLTLIVEVPTPPSAELKGFESRCVILKQPDWSIDDLPGMWDESDLSGGLADSQNEFEQPDSELYSPAINKAWDRFQSKLNSDDPMKVKQPDTAEPSCHMVEVAIHDVKESEHVVVQIDNEATAIDQDDWYSIIESCLKRVSNGNLNEAPFPFTGISARAWLDGASAAYQHALEMYIPASKLQRITEQDTREILQSFSKWIDLSEAFSAINTWLVTYDGKSLLTKLNEHREPSYKAQRDLLLAATETIEYVNFLYSKGLIERPYQYRKLEQAIAQCEGKIQ
jgi:hypothetical protein